MAVALGIGIPSVMIVFRAMVRIVGKEMRKANAEQVVGGPGLRCEADEIARTRRAGVEDGVRGVWWLR